MFIAIVMIIIVIYLTKNTRNKYTPKNYKYKHNKHEQSQQTKETKINYIDGYKKIPLLSNHEYEAYKRIKAAADERKYTVFTKVRLLDLIEPKNINQKEQAYLWKIWAKHVDFVVCDEELNAKWIIELQDSTHDREDRIERDNLVKALLTNCNYKILMTYTATTEEIRSFLSMQPRTLAGEEKLTPNRAGK